VVEHNIPINVSDHLVNLIKTINLGPKHLSKLTCDRTKCISIISNVIAATGFEVTDQFLTLFPVANATTDSMYQAITNFFNSHNISYKTNLIGFAADGANAMMGKNHSLQSLLKNDNNELFIPWHFVLSMGVENCLMRSKR